MIAGYETQNAAWVAERRSPDRSVGSRSDRIEAGVDAVILSRIDRLIRLRILAARAVSVRVEDQRRPPLRLLLVAGLVEELCIEPSQDGSAPARPQCPMRVLGEHQ